MIEEAKRDEHGRMLEPLPGKHTITKADASILAQKRWNIYRQEAVKKITGEIASIEPGVTTGAAAFAVIASKQALALLDSEKPRINDLVKLGELMTGKSVSAEPQRDHAANGAITIAPSTLIQLAEEIELYAQAKRDKARAVDAVTHDPEPK